MNSYTITTLAELRERYSAPSPTALATRCIFPTLELGIVFAHQCRNHLL